MITKRPFLRIYNPFERKWITGSANYVTDIMKLEAETDIYTSLQWENCYNDAGEFEIHMPYKTGYYELFAPFKLVYINRPIKEPFGIIVYQNIGADEKGRVELVVKGKMLSHIFSFRGIRTTGAMVPAEMRPASFVNGLIENGIKSPSGGNYTTSLLGKAVKTVDRTGTAHEKLGYDYAITSATLYDEISLLCKANDIGFHASCDMDEERVVFTEYNYNQNSAVLFDIELGNIKSINITRSIDNYINGYFFNEGYDLKTGTLHGEQDIKRIEKKINIPFTDTSDMYQKSHAYCESQLGDNYMSNEIVFDVTQTNKFYTRDYQIGDIVTANIHQLGISATKPITSVREIWERGYKIEVGLGQRMMTAYQKLREGVIR